MRVGKKRNRSEKRDASRVYQPTGVFDYGLGKRITQERNYDFSP